MSARELDTLEPPSVKRRVRAELNAALPAGWGPSPAAEIRADVNLVRACLATEVTPERRFAASVALERRAIAAEERLVARMPGRTLLRMLRR